MLRLDRGAFTHSLTAEGYLAGRAVVTKVGVFPYLEPDGSTRLEFKPPEEAFAQASLDSMRLKPVTNGHPPELVTAQNVNTYSVGSTGESVSVEGENVAVSFTVYQADAISAIKAGRQELSLGYLTDVVEEQGAWQGQPYTHVQKNIRYNHLALVDVARVGSIARINMDGAQSVECGNGVIRDDEELIPVEKALKNLRLNGIDYRADAEVVHELEKAHEQVAAHEAAAKEAKASAEALSGQVDELKAELEGVKEAHNDAAIDALVKERVALLAAAKRVVNVDGMEGKSARSIKEAALLAKHPTLELGGKSDEYVSARFDALVDALPSEEDAAMASQKLQASTVHSDGAAPKGISRQALNQKFHGGKA